MSVAVTLQTDFVASSMPAVAISIFQDPIADRMYEMVENTFAMC